MKTVNRSLVITVILCSVFIGINAAAFGQNKISITNGGKIWVNGKPFFAIGSYYLPNSKHPYETLAKDGFNLIQCPKDLKALDRAKKAGLMAWVSFGSELDFSHDAKYKKSKIIKTVRKLRKNPALLVWESRDEPAWTWKNPAKPAVSVNGLVRGQLFLKSQDPDHPIWINHAPRNLVKTLVKFSQGTKIVSCDIYPVIPSGIKNMYAIKPDGTQGDLLNRTISQVGDYTKKMRKVAGKDRAVWMVLQAFAWEDLLKPTKRDTNKILYPSYTQLRFMAYDAVINGANGILYWGSKFLPQPSKCWTSLKKVVKELSEMSTVFLAKNIKRKLKLNYIETGYSMDNAIEIKLKKFRNKLFILTANTSPYPAKVSISGFDKLNNPSMFRVLGENRKISLKNGKFTEFFKGFGVHVYAQIL